MPIALLMAGGSENASAATWAPARQVSPQAATWYTLDLEIGINGVYVLSSIYGDANGQYAQVFKSANGGLTWSSASPVFGGEPGMCLYNSAGKDILIIAAGPNLVKSTNNGQSWKYLSTMPDAGWRFMAVGTNASWTGAPVDDDIYVMGSIGGGKNIGFAKSADGGLSWTVPKQLTNNNFAYNTMPRITSDGSRLYVIYEIASNNNAVASIVTRTSNDWGETWSQETGLISNKGSSYMLRPYSFHTLNNQRAIMTYVDKPSNLDAATTTGNYGYYNFATLAYEPVGWVSGQDWMIGEGFSGNVVEDVFYVAWIKCLDQVAGTPNTAIMFTSSTDTGLSSQVPPPDARLDKGTSQVSWTFGAGMAGTWSAKILNHGGVKYFTLVVTDITVPRKPVVVFTQKIDFIQLGAFPNGWAFSDSVPIVPNHTYQMTAKQPNGYASSYVLIYGQFVY